LGRSREKNAKKESVSGWEGTGGRKRAHSRRSPGEKTGFSMNKETNLWGNGAARQQCKVAGGKKLMWPAEGPRGTKKAWWGGAGRKKKKKKKSIV